MEQGRPIYGHGKGHKAEGPRCMSSVFQGTPLTTFVARSDTVAVPSIETASLFRLAVSIEHDLSTSFQDLFSE